MQNQGFVCPTFEPEQLVVTDTTIVPLFVRVMSNDYIKLIVYKYALNFNIYNTPLAAFQTHVKQKIGLILVGVRLLQWVLDQSFVRAFERKR